MSIEGKLVIKWDKSLPWWKRIFKRKLIYYYKLYPFSGVDNSKVVPSFPIFRKENSLKDADVEFIRIPLDEDFPE